MEGKVQFVFKKVAVVEKFFDIIYSVHVESSTGDTQLRGRAGKHCGQKRTYRAVSLEILQRVSGGEIFILCFINIYLHFSNC